MSFITRMHFSRRKEGKQIKEKKFCNERLVQFYAQKSQLFHLMASNFHSNEGDQTLGDFGSFEV